MQCSPCILLLLFILFSLFLLFLGVSENYDSRKIFGLSAPQEKVFFSIFDLLVRILLLYIKLHPHTLLQALEGLLLPLNW